MRKGCHYRSIRSPGQVTLEHVLCGYYVQDGTDGGASRPPPDVAPANHKASGCPTTTGTLALLVCWVREVRERRGEVFYILRTTGGKEECTETENVLQCQGLCGGGST